MRLLYSKYFDLGNFGGGIIEEPLIDNVKYDYYKTEDGCLLHRQIEKRDGLVFMRMKKRPAIIVQRKQNMPA